MMILSSPKKLDNVISLLYNGNMRKIEISLVDELKVVDAYNSGIPVYKIGKHLNIKVNIKAVLHKHGIKIVNKNYTKVTNEQREYVIAEYSKGATMRELTTYLGLKNTSLVSKILKDGNIDIASDIRKSNRYSKVKPTNLSKYGVENQFQRQSIIDENYTLELNNKRNALMVASNLEKYGVENVFELESVKDKSKNTCLEKYGDTNIVRTQKYKDDSILKYGVDHPTKSDEVKLVNRNTCLEKYGSTSCSNTHLSENTIKTIESKELLETLYIECNKSIDLMGIKLGDIKKPSLTKRLVDYGIYEPNNTSGLELLVEHILIEYVNNRKLDGCSYRPDFIIEGSKLVIECDGLYWHCDKVDDRYHREKFEAYVSVGYKMLSFHTGELLGQYEIVKSMILNACGRSNRIYARKCDIKLVSTNDLVGFLNNNHIQGYSKSSINIGLYYNDKLVSIMTFCKSRRSKFAEYELMRFCNILNFSVVGGASKLFKYFIRNYSSSVLSYSESRRGIGKLYSLLGFELKADNKIGYYYTYDFYTLEGRVKYQKGKLAKIFPECYKDEYTERQIMTMAGYERYTTCGTRTWLYK